MAEENNIDALTFIEDNDVKFIRMQFTSLFGQNKNIAISNTQFQHILFTGVAFDGSAIEGYFETEDETYRLYPDLSTMQILPWRPQRGKVARLICDIKKNKDEYAQSDCRHILRKQIIKAEKAGYHFDFGTECEFFLFKIDENGQPITVPSDEAGYLDLAPVDKGENTRREIILTLENMGFEIESSHHESAKGQHEIDFSNAETLEAADNLMTFKHVVKTIAGRNGYHASFMPKPLNGESGSGMHINVGFSDNLPGDHSMTQAEAESFAKGVMTHIDAITALANPLINSYKRLCENRQSKGQFISGYRLIQHQNGYSIQFRTPDPSCNPYLVYATILAAGLEGLEGLVEGDIKVDQKLPASLKEALDAMEKDTMIETVLGEKIKRIYLEKKRQEVNDFMTCVHAWETEHYFKYI